jgi:hypothetical protein
MYSCGPIFMCGNCNGTVKQCDFKQQSIYHPQYVLCDTPFVTYIYCYMFRHRGAILREYSYQRYIINITIYVPLLPIWCRYAINGVSQVHVLDDILTVRTRTV